jgi:hypothetical protein
MTIRDGEGRVVGRVVEKVDDASLTIRLSSIDLGVY